MSLFPFPSTSALPEQGGRFLTLHALYDSDEGRVSFYFRDPSSFGDVPEDVALANGFTIAKEQLEQIRRWCEERGTGLICKKSL